MRKVIVRLPPEPPPEPKKKLFEPDADFKKYGEAMLPIGLPWLLRLKRLLMLTENANE